MGKYYFCGGNQNVLLFVFCIPLGNALSLSKRMPRLVENNDTRNRHSVGNVSFFMLMWIRGE
ncbi:MAG: hypothetical protein FWH18_00085 [Marinilabiliaceae bacterium]|nr:hypothetical protein [Marinilabiliaceae bacterium]